MKKNKKKMLTILITVIAFITMLLPTIVKATVVDIPKPEGTIDQGLQTLTGKILNYAQWIGMAVAVAMIIFYGVRYFTADPAKQGELKKAIWGYIIGAVAIFGASIILGFISRTLVPLIPTT